MKQNIFLQISCDNAAFWISLLMFASILINLYGMVIFMGVVTANLPRYNLRPKYLGVQLTLLTTFFISAIIGVCASAGAIPCRPPFSVEARASSESIYHIYYMSSKDKISLSISDEISPVSVHVSKDWSDITFPNDNVKEVYINVTCTQ